MAKAHTILEQGNQNSAFTRIQRFYSAGDITLTQKEEEILQRWILCYKLIRQRKFTEEEIIEKIVKLYAVSQYTARNDIYQAMSLHGDMIKANKKLLLYNHAELILLTIEKKKKSAGAESLSRLFDSYTKAVAAIPDEINKDAMPPPQMLFFIVPGQQIDSVKKFEDAIASIAKRNNSNIQDADFEEVK